MVDITLHQFTSLLFVTFGCACAPLTRNSRKRFELQPSLVRSFVRSISLLHPDLGSHSPETLTTEKTEENNRLLLSAAEAHHQLREERHGRYKVRGRRKERVEVS